MFRLQAVTKHFVFNELFEMLVKVNWRLKSFFSFSWENKVAHIKKSNNSVQQEKFVDYKDR